ncbi:MAG: hypothetical protein ACK53L_29285, partial [Pirellulaceae bacterium]
MKLNISGGTMTGTLYMNTTNKSINLATPTLGTDATTKTYVDTADANLSGGTMSGILNMNNIKITNIGTPTLSTDVTSKNYVDNGDSLKLNLSGGTMT